MSGPYWDTQWNVVQGCTPVSEGCAHCWARSMHERFHEEPFSKVRTMPDRLSKPLHWRKPRVVFVCNTSDLFHEAVPFEFIAAVFGVMAACPQHTFLVLTKRAERMRACIETFASYHDHSARQDPEFPLGNVWLGITVENQARANERIPLLLQTPAAHRWVSVEPLIGPINFDQVSLLPSRPELMRWCYNPLVGGGRKTDTPWRINQVIVGGESGPRPCNVEWIRSLRDQCREAGVPCFVKQLGSTIVDEGAWGLAHAVCGLRDRAGADPSEWPEDLRVRDLAWRKP